MSEQSQEEIQEEMQYQTISEFLESTPPNQLIHISDLATWKATQYSSFNALRTPEIQLHCSNEKCNGIRFFRCTSGKEAKLEKTDYDFFYITYLCSKCQKIEKTFSLAGKVAEDKKSEGLCYKFGELPTFGPPVAPRLIKLIGPDRDNFLGSSSH